MAPRIGLLDADLNFLADLRANGADSVTVLFKEAERLRTTSLAER